MVESALSGERAALPPPGPPSRQIGRPSDQNRTTPREKVGGTVHSTLLPPTIPYHGTNATLFVQGSHRGHTFTLGVGLEGIT